MTTAQITTDRVKGRYQEFRQKYGMSASNALRAAQQTDTTEAIDWQDGRGRAVQTTSFDHKEYHVHATIEADDYADLSYLGEYTQTETENTIDRQARGDAGRNEYRYFEPCYTYSSYFKSLRAMHYGKAESDILARKYVLQDYKTMENLASGQSCMGSWVVTVSVSKYGEELGSDSLWGIESELGDSYLDSVVWDCLANAIAEAETTIEKIKND